MFMAIWGEFLPLSKHEIHISMWYDIDVEVLWCSLTSNPVLGAVEETSSSACVRVESGWLVRGGGKVITYFLIITFSIFHLHLLMVPNNLIYPQEELILDIVNDPQCDPKQFRHSYLRSIVVFLLVTLVVRNLHLLLIHTNNVLQQILIYLHCVQLVVIIGLTHALVICRVITAILLAKSESPFLRDHSTTIAMLSGAVLHYITIQVMTRVSTGR